MCAILFGLIYSRRTQQRSYLLYLWFMLGLSVIFSALSETTAIASSQAASWIARWKTALAALIFILAVATKAPFVGYLYDDAYVTFRYVENAVAGHGLVYNVGERALGATSGLYLLRPTGLATLGFGR